VSEEAVGIEARRVREDGRIVVDGILLETYD
jgi:hypothetical protein